MYSRPLAWLIAWTDAPGTAAAELSVTIPVIVAVSVCADVIATTRKSPANKAETVRKLDGAMRNTPFSGIPVVRGHRSAGPRRPLSCNRAVRVVLILVRSQRRAGRISAVNSQNRQIHAKDGQSMPPRPLRAFARAAWFGAGWVSVAIEGCAHSAGRAAAGFADLPLKFRKGGRRRAEGAEPRLSGSPSSVQPWQAPKALTCESTQLPRAGLQPASAYVGSSRPGESQPQVTRPG